MAAVPRQQLIPEILAKSCHPRRRARLSCPNQQKKGKEVTIWRVFTAELSYLRKLVPYENTVHGVVGTALEMICDSKFNNDLVIQHSNYSKQDKVSSESVEQLFNVECTNYLGCCIEQTRINELNVSLAKWQTTPTYDRYADTLHIPRHRDVPMRLVPAREEHWRSSRRRPRSRKC